ncbi:MAG: hypothetical protein ACI9T7_003666 [Oleiphilaceae bacterium]|jgi:hypothetical protein
MQEIVFVGNVGAQRFFVKPINQKPPGSGQWQRIARARVQWKEIITLSVCHVKNALFPIDQPIEFNPLTNLFCQLAPLQIRSTQYNVS